MPRTPPSSATQAVDRLARTLAERGLPLTDQRRVIYETLVVRKDHPTADEVHAAIVAVLPRVSLATVYRTLETFVALDVVRRVAHPGAKCRYDAKLERHHHMLCTRCGKLSDVESSRLDAVRLPRGLGFEVTDYTFQLRGLCSACSTRKRKGGK